MHQQAILKPLPPHGRYLQFQLSKAIETQQLQSLLSDWNVQQDVIGFGPRLLDLCGGVEGMHAFPDWVGPQARIVSTQTDLWLWLRGDEPGELALRSLNWSSQLSDYFELQNIVDGFVHRGGRDLTGYEDGTENPSGDDAVSAAVVATGPLQGSSYVAVQLWQHDFSAFDRHTQAHKDHMIGRRLSDNVELDDAPAFAHTKRTAQEQFTPEAFVLRRSMPWANAAGEGLNFVAFGCSLYAFEAQMKNMLGLNDGITDGLFQFSEPVSGAYFWCPPVTAQGLSWEWLPG